MCVCGVQLDERTGTSIFSECTCEYRQAQPLSNIIFLQRKTKLFLRLYPLLTHSTRLPDTLSHSSTHSLRSPLPHAHDPNRDNTADALHVLVRQLRYVAKPIHSLGHLSNMKEWVSVCECSEPHTQGAR